MMKQLAAALALCLLLTGCGGGRAATADGESGGQTAWTAEQIAWALWTGQEDLPEESRGLAAGQAAFEDYLTAYYRLDPESVEDGYLRCAGGMSAAEVAVLRFREDTDMETVQEALLAYRDERTGDFTGYLPEQAELAENGTAVTQGAWAALLLCPRPEDARRLFSACFGGDAPEPLTPRWDGEAEAEPVPENAEAETPETQSQEPAEDRPAEPAQAAAGPAGEAPAKQPAEKPSEMPGETPAEQPAPPSTPEEASVPVPGPEPEPPEPAPVPPANVYDGGAVRTAWDTGDDTGLSEKSRAVLQSAREVIDANIRDGMSQYQQELAIHDWMVAWASYDHDTLSHVPGEEGGSDSDNPYGFLVGKKGICLGYSSTFQLFMDLLDIPCRTVRGTAHAGTADHAWNLVRLDGEWYGVDVTWDDPTTHIKVTAEMAHRFFNVTSQYLRDNDHQWDGNGVPEAEGTAWAWKK